MSATLDDEGRLYLPEEVQERYGRRFRIVQLHDGVKLIPLSDDPMKNLQETLAPLRDVDTDELTQAAEEEALKGHRRERDELDSLLEETETLFEGLEEFSKEAKGAYGR